MNLDAIRARNAWLQEMPDERLSISEIDKRDLLAEIDRLRAELDEAEALVGKLRARLAELPGVA